MVVGRECMSIGRPFDAVGAAATFNVWSPILSRVHGMNNWSLPEDRRTVQREHGVTL